MKTDDAPTAFNQYKQNPDFDGHESPQLRRILAPVVDGYMREVT